MSKLHPELREWLEKFDILSKLAQKWSISFSKKAWMIISISWRKTLLILNKLKDLWIVVENNYDEKQEFKLTPKWQSIVNETSWFVNSMITWQII